MPYARKRIRPRHGESGTDAAAGRPPRLEPTAELKLVVAAKQPGSDARAELIDTFTPLVASVARIYRGSSVSRAELMQEGAVGLLRALERYDVKMGTPFWAYASWWVRQAMQQLVSQLTRPVVLSDRAVRQLARVKDARRDLLQAHSAEPSIDQLAERTGLERAQVENLLAADWMPRPLEEPIGGDDGGSTFGDQLADPRAEDAYDRVPRRLAAEGLRPVIGSLTRREKTILAGRFGFQGPEQTLRELGDSLGVSAERVRQIETRALDKLRSAAGQGLTLPTPCPTYAKGKVDGRERPSKTTKGAVMTTLMEPVAPWLRDLNRLFTSEGNQFLPPADVLVDGEGVTVHMDVPGLQGEDLDIELENDVLTVRGERPNPYGGEGDDGERDTWRRIERGFGRFERSLRVPRGLNPDAIQASLRHGVLTLRIPKPDELKPRRIQVQEAGSPQQIEGATA